MKKRKEVKCWVVMPADKGPPFAGCAETDGWRLMAWDTRKAARQFQDQQAWEGEVRRATLIIEDTHDR